MRDWALGVYTGLTGLLAGLAPLWLRWRARRGKEERARLTERLGWASEKRPHGALIWLHGASVGEAKVMLVLIEALARQRPDLHFLVTSGTLTSARILGAELPPSARHQFVPVDTPQAARRFVAHWQPDLGIFTESELWPNLILAARRAGVRLALVNARMNTASLRRWRRFGHSARTLLDSFAFIGAADLATRDGLAAITGKAPVFCGNLKRAAPAPWVNEQRLKTLRQAIGTRPVWLAASTHDGEERIIIEAHRALSLRFERALLIIAPRHPERGKAIAALCHRHRLALRRRAAGEEPDSKISVYIADTLGEMGLWMRLAGLVFMGGSLLPRLHGHNPIEAAKLHAAILSGPYHDSFSGPYNDLAVANAFVETGDAPAIASAVADLWTHPEQAQAMQARAFDMTVRGGREAVQNTLRGLAPLLPEAP